MIVNKNWDCTESVITVSFTKNQSGELNYKVSYVYSNENEKTRYRILKEFTELIDNLNSLTQKGVTDDDWWEKIDKQMIKLLDSYFAKREIDKPDKYKYLESNNIIL